MEIKNISGINKLFNVECPWVRYVGQEKLHIRKEVAIYGFKHYFLKN